MSKVMMWGVIVNRVVIVIVVIVIITIGVLADIAIGLKVVAEGSVAREKMDAIFLRCDVTELGPEDEIVRVTWRHNHTGHGVWNDIFTVDLTNDNPAYIFLSQWAGRGQYNPISLAVIMLSPIYVTRYLAGTYRCDVESAMARGFSEVTVDVLYGPGTSIVITPGGRVQKEEGRELRVMCQAQCNPSCSYRWYKLGRRISSSPSLQMASLSRQDGGLYACQARNHVGRSIKPVEIRVLYPPAILALTSLGSESRPIMLRRKDVTAKNISLQCEIQSWPDGHIQWFKESTLLQNTSAPPVIVISTSNTNREHKTSRLDIQNPTCLNNGVYWCKADNSIGGQVTRSINITKNYPPLEVTKSKLCPFKYTAIQKQDSVVEMETKFGEEILIQFCFSGYPKPSVEVVGKNGSGRDVAFPEKDIRCNDDNNVCSVVISFVIKNPHQYGKYEVKVLNTLKSFTKSYTIISRQPPLPPQNVTIATVSPTSVCVLWNAGYNGGASQVFNLTVAQLDLDLDGQEDKNFPPKSLIVEEKPNLVISEKGNKSIVNVSRSNNVDTDNKTTHKDLINFSRELGDKKLIVNNNIKETANVESFFHSSCLTDLKSSYFYSLRVTASNKFGKSEFPDVLIFKTLDIATSTSSSTSTFGTTVKKTSSTSTSSKGYNSTVFAISGHSYFPPRLVSDFDDFPFLDEGADGKEKKPLIPEKSMFPTFDDDFKHLISYGGGDITRNSNDDGNQGIIDTDDDDDIDYDDDSYFEDIRLFRMLFPYFDDVLSREKSNPISPGADISENWSTKSPQRLFKVGRYFKRYVRIDKQKHISIPDEVFPPAPTIASPSTKYKDDDKSSTKFDLDTIPTPQTQNALTIVAYAASAAAIIVMLIILVGVTLFFRRKMTRFPGQRPQHKRSSVSMTAPLKTITSAQALRHTNTSSQPITRHSDTSGLSMTCHTTNTSSQSSSRHRLSSPLKFSASESVSSSENSRNKKTHHNKEHVNTTQGRGKMTIAPNKPNADRINNQTTKTNEHIKIRPRLSTPKLPQRDKTCYSMTPSSSTTSHRLQPAPLPPPTSHTARIPPHSPHSPKLNGLSVLTIPGISLNDKQLSSPTYLEICTGSSSSESELPVCRPKSFYDDCTLSISGFPTSSESRRSSYSSVVVPSAKMDILGKWELDKCNSYLDLCEALSAKSGSKSPSNIYDPLDLYDKFSVQSECSYMGPSTPECSRKGTSGSGCTPECAIKGTNGSGCTPECAIKGTNGSGFLINSKNQRRLEKQLNSPKQIKNLLSKKKLCIETSDDSLHYEKCVSLMYDKDETREDVTQTSETEKPEVTHGSAERNEDRSKTSSNQEIPLEPVESSSPIEYMNEETGRGADFQSSRHSNSIHNLFCFPDIENNLSVYNEINNTHPAENAAAILSVSKQGKQSGGPNRNDIVIVEKDVLPENQQQSHTYKNSCKLKSVSPFSTVKKLQKATKSQTMNRPTSENKQTCPLKGGYNIRGRQSTRDSGQNKKDGDPIQPVEAVDQVCRTNSGHYYSDIDCN